MSTLLVLLPPGSPSSTLEYEYAVSHDGLTFASRGSAPLQQLPTLSGAGHDLVLVAPISQLSWHTVELPSRITGPQLRPALQSLVEETLLDEPTQLHLALGPAPDASRQVVACDKAWLQTHLHALEERGYALARIVPEFEPTTSTPTHLHVRDGGSGLQLVCMSVGRLCVLPLNAAAVRWAQADASTELSADAASARAAETFFNQSVSLRTRDQVWLDALRSEWNLAQFDLACQGTAHRLRQGRRAWNSFITAPQWRAARWFAFVLVVIQLVGLNAWAWRERSLIESQRRLQKDLLQQTFPDVTVVIDPPLQMQRQLAQLQQSRGGADTGAFDALLFAVASSPAALPRPDNLDFRDGVLRLPGYALSAEQSDALRAHLQASGFALSADASGLTVSAQKGRP